MSEVYDAVKGIERDNDIVMRICIGRDNNSSIYSNGYQKRKGQPIDISATEVFEDMISKD